MTVSKMAEQLSLSAELLSFFACNTETVGTFFVTFLLGRVLKVEIKRRAIHARKIPIY